MRDEVIQLKERPPYKAKVYCSLNSGKSKSRKAVYFGEVTVDGKIIREDCYMLVQNEPKTTYLQVPRISKRKGE